MVLQFRNPRKQTPVMAFLGVNEPPTVHDEEEEESPVPDGIQDHRNRSGTHKEIQMQLLTVPEMSLGPTLEETGGGSGGGRRYSYSHSGKLTSPNTRRRSSLAAIKWSALARRLSHGMGHDREPPDDPEKVCERLKGFHIFKVVW